MSKKISLDELKKIEDEKKECDRVIKEKKEELILKYDVLDSLSIQILNTTLEKKNDLISNYISEFAKFFTDNKFDFNQEEENPYLRTQIWHATYGTKTFSITYPGYERLDLEGFMKNTITLVPSIEKEHQNYEEIDAPKTLEILNIPYFSGPEDFKTNLMKVNELSIDQAAIIMQEINDNIAKFEKFLSQIDTYQYYMYDNKEDKVYVTFNDFVKEYFE